MPARDPAYARKPWACTGVAGWGAALLLGPLAGAVAVGAAWAYLEARAASRADAAAAAAAAAPKARAGGGAMLEAQRAPSAAAPREALQVHATASQASQE